MLPIEPQSCTAFAGQARLATGSIRDVALATKRFVNQDDSTTILIFDNATSQPVEIDLRGTADEVLSRLGERFSVPPAAAIADTGTAREAPDGQAVPNWA